MAKTSSLSSAWERIGRYRVPLLVLLLLAVFGLGMLVQGVWRGWTAPEPTPVQPHADHEHVHDPEAPVTGLRQLTVSRAARELMNIEVTPVEQRYVTAVVRMVGKVDLDETRVRSVTARARGRLDRLFVDFTGIEVREGDHMAEIYSEDLIVAQEELIQALRMGRPERQPAAIARVEAGLVEAARRSLRRLGLSDEQIEEVEQRQRPMDHLTIYAPVGGTVIEKLRNEGDRVEIGDRIYRIADLEQVWVLMDAYESDLPWVRYGQEVEFTTEAYPGERFPGRISFIDPVLDERTRTVNVRVNVPNPQRKLKPEMFVRGVVRAQVAEGGRVIDPDLEGMWLCRMHPEVVDDGPGECDICGMDLVPAETFGYVAPRPDEVPPPLVIPVTAALVTGTRAIVYVEVPGTELPTFEGREIVLGPRAGDHYLVKHGLREGELVVTRGNFKIDADLQIAARPSMMSPEGAPAPVHDHGHDTPDMPMPDEPEAMVGPMPVPTPVAEQLHALEMAASEAARAVRSEDLPRIRQAFREFGQALDAVERDRLTGHARMVWNELEMLLRNDAVEGEQVERLGEARRILESLRRDVRRIREQFLVQDHTDEHVH